MSEALSPVPAGPAPGGSCESAPSCGLVLRQLPLPARLVLSVFLISVGIGYIAALVQLHFQHASPGKLLPTPQDAVRVYHGEKLPRPMSQIERLLEADEKLKFNGSGQMRTAFTTDSKDWESALEEKKLDLNGDEKRAEAELRKEREGERLAMLAWIRAGARKTEFEADRFELPANLRDHPLTGKFKLANGPTPSVKIFSLFKARCITCHKDGGKASGYPLETFEQIQPRLNPEGPTNSTAMSLTKLAQSTHVHLLGFSMLYGLTGLILAFSSYPVLLRVILCPLPLVAQIIDISFWWLARLDPMYAKMISYTGGVVAIGLLSHILLSLFNMYGKQGRMVLAMILLGAGAGAYSLKCGVVDPYLASQEQAPQAHK